jgi:hypothetical protein
MRSTSPSFTVTVVLTWRLMRVGDPLTPGYRGLEAADLAIDGHVYFSATEYFWRHFNNHARRTIDNILDAVAGIVLSRACDRWRLISYIQTALIVVIACNPTIRYLFEPTVERTCGRDSRISQLEGSGRDRSYIQEFSRRLQDGNQRVGDTASSWAANTRAQAYIRQPLHDERREHLGASKGAGTCQPSDHYDLRPPQPRALTGSQAFEPAFAVDTSLTLGQKKRAYISVSP